MKIVKKLLSELKRPEKNVRMHSDKQINEFKRSVKMFGQIRPIVIDENNVILAGNGLYDTLIALEYENADCYVVKDLSENDKKKLMLADNRIFSLGVDDLSAFDEIIAELGDDLDVPGYDDELLKMLTAEPDDVDDMMSSYGLVSEEKKQEIINNAEKYTVNNNAEMVAKPLPQNDSTKSENEVSDLSKDNTERDKYIICPKCGEQIWL